MARRALTAHEQRAAGVSVYQTDLGVQWPGQVEALASLSDPDRLRAWVESHDVQQRYPVTDENRLFGIDNHSPQPDHMVDVDEL